MTPTLLQIHHLESLVRQREDTVATLAEIDQQIEDYKKEMLGV